MTIARFIRRATVGFVALVITALLAGASWEMTMRKNALRSIVMPGQLIDAGNGRRLQLDCRGEGTPTVVLESGLDTYGSLAWAAVHDSLAMSTRVCAYSRAGIMWSDAATGAFNARSAARELRTTLRFAGEAPPFVMVGHSLGGPYAMIFTSMHDDEVAGMVLVDASHPDQFERFREATGKDLLPSAGTVKTGAALAWTGIVRLLPAAPTPAAWPAMVSETSQLFLGTSLGGLAREIDEISGTLETAGTKRLFRNIPLVVLSAGKPLSAEEIQMLNITPEQNSRREAAVLELQKDLARWSSRSRHEVVADASHYIQFDRPDVVIKAVREVLAALTNQPSASSRQ